MATKTAQKRQIPFSKAGMLGFKNINDAVKYFSLRENGGHSRRSISFLFGETFELNVGSLSLNMASVLNDSKMFEKVLANYLKSKPTLAEKVKMSVEVWVKNNDPKRGGIKEVEKLESEKAVLAAHTDTTETI
jgi:hypothetical protein